MTTYKIIRFFKGNRASKVLKTGLTLEEAQKHCQREDTHKLNIDDGVEWFDGYDED